MPSEEQPRVPGGRLVLRAVGGEVGRASLARAPRRGAPVSIGVYSTRANEWIHRLRDASDNPAAKAKAKPKGKAKAKGKQAEDPLAAEPKHASLDEAFEAAKACTKCEYNKDGSKGCRGCMEEHFEEVRRRGFLARAFKDLDKKA